MVIEPSAPPQLVGSEVKVTVNVGVLGSVNVIEVLSILMHNGVATFHTFQLS